MDTLATTNSGRRKLLRALPAATTAGLALVRGFSSSSLAEAQAAPAASGPSFQLFSAGTIATDRAALDAAPGNNNLVDDGTFTVALTVEKAKAGEEFEWHEGRDHIFQILAGSTVYEVGGTPKNGRNVKPGEWLAPESEGATTFTLNPGDMLVIRRGTPHRRTTKDSVTLTLISPQGTLAS
jgi:mannose-6-phosphate isomerase-like protein (cupin superfamily)